MPQEEEAMEEANINCKAAAQGLSWRSRRDQASWWTSAMDLSSTLIAKMDKVPMSLVGFALPWPASARGDQSKLAQFAEKQQPVELPQSRNEIAKPALPVEIAKPPLDYSEPGEGEAEGNSPKGEAEVNSPKGDTEETTSARGVTPQGAESRRRTKRMPVECIPAGPNPDSDAPIRSKKLSAVSQEFLLGQGQGTNPTMRVHAVEIRRLHRHRKVSSVDDASVLSSRRLSSRSLCQGSLLEETIRNNPPHALPRPPGDSTPSPKPNRFCKDALLGASLRVTRSCEALEVDHDRPSASLPSSPRSRSRTVKESRASKLLKTLGMGKLSKENGLQVVKNNLIVSQYQQFAKSLEPRKPGITNGVRNHADHHPSVRNRDGNNAVEQQHSINKKKSSSRWLFKWRWGSKPTVTATPQAVNAISDAPRAHTTIRDTFYEVESGAASMRHVRSSSWGCASNASTAVISPVRHSRRSRIHQDDNDATENAVESRAGSVDGDVSQSFEVLENTSSCHGSIRSVFGGQQSEVFEDCHGSFRSAELFEHCHGSFRSGVTTTAGSCASFRSVDSEEMEWNPVQADETLTIGDVAALCNSSFKFVFKCREIQHFNKFLRSQKKRLLSSGASETGNVADCFHVILSGTDIEVSSMVAAMCYAWFLHNTAPKLLTGQTWHAVAVIDTPRHQMHKHKDAAWLFDACGIDPAALLFADEMEFASLVGAGRVKLSTIGQDILVTRNEVGSVCTLLAEKLVTEAQCLLEPRYMKTLLLAGVLLDTENLDFASTRDTDMTTTLLVGSGSLGRNGFFDQLREVAEDDEQVSKFITRSYGDSNKRLSRRKTFSFSAAAAAQCKMQAEGDQDQSDRDSVFTHSQDQTSTSEAGTSSSVDEDSPRLQPCSSKYTKSPHSANNRPHQLHSPPSTGCKAATQFPRIRKRLCLYRM